MPIINTPNTGLKTFSRTDGPEECPALSSRKKQAQQRSVNCSEMEMHPKTGKGRS